MNRTLRMVIVEDDALIGRYLDDLLSVMGHKVCAIARTQDDAVAAAKLHQPELMIVDGNLEKGTGVAAMREILAQGFIPHFYVTGNALEIARTVEDGIIITKPFNLRDLKEAIARALLTERKPDGSTPAPS